MTAVKVRAGLGAVSDRRPGSGPLSVVAGPRPSRLGLVGRGVPAEHLLAVQKAVGNRAFTHAVQRLPASGVGTAACAPPLEHSRFAGNARLQSAARNSPTLSQNERGEPVKVLQQALHDLGPPFLLPKTMRTGAPDGVWGDETRTALRRFQQDNGIPPGGHEAGLRTLTKLDCIYLAKEPHDDKLEAGEVPGRMSATTTKPAAADSKGTVKQRPEGKVSLDTAKTLPAKEEKEPLVKGEVAIGGQLLLATTEKDHKPKACDFAQVEVSGLVNYRVLRLGDRVMIAAKPTLSLDLLPSLCQDRHEFPTLKLQLDVVKVMISEQVEVALAAGAGVKDALRQPRGWLESGVTLGISLGKLRGVPVKIELGINGELPIARERKPDGSFDDHAEVHFVGGFVFF